MDWNEISGKVAEAETMEQLYNVARQLWAHSPVAHSQARAEMLRAYHTASQRHGQAGNGATVAHVAGLCAAKETVNTLVFVGH